MIRSAIIFMILALILTACGGDAAPADNAAAATPAGESVSVDNAEPALPLNDDGLQLVAMVNGEGITLMEFNAVFERQRLQDQMSSYEIAAASVVDLLIEQQLIRQAAARMGITVSDTDIDAALAEHRALVADDIWAQWLDDNGFQDEASFRQSLGDEILTRRVIEVVTSTGGPIQIREVHARHILLDTEAQANEMMTRLGSGEDFGQLAAAYSKDVTTRNNGGDLGWFSIDGLLTPELAQVAFNLQPNEIAGPVSTMLGYHVIQTLEFNERSAIPEEQPELIAEQFNNWLQTVLDDAIVERYVNY